MHSYYSTVDEFLTKKNKIPVVPDFSVTLFRVSYDLTINKRESYDKVSIVARSTLIKYIEKIKIVVRTEMVLM